VGTEFDLSSPSDNRVGNVRIANTFHLAVGGIFALAGLAMLYAAQVTLRGDGFTADVGRQCGVAITLLLVGGLNIARSMRFWAFRFDDDSVSDPGPQTNGKADPAHYLSHLLDEGVRPGAGFSGAIGGLLAVIAPRLSMAPEPVRLHAYVQALRALNLAVLLAGFGLAWIMADATVLPYMATLFFVFALAVVKPHDAVRAAMGSVGAGAQASVPTLGKTIALLAIAVLGPTSLALLVSQGLLPPAPAGLSALSLPTLAILLPALAGSALFFMALSRQTRALSQSKVEWRWDTTFRAPDRTDGVLTHLERHIPDPKKCHVRFFRVDGAAEGSLSGRFIYETRPRLSESGTGALHTVFRQAWREPSTRPLIVLDLLGLVLGLVACAVFVRFGATGGYALIAMAVGLLSSSHFCMLAAHRLWLRADFHSLVYDVSVDAEFAQIQRTQGNTTYGGGVYRDSALNVKSGRLAARVTQMHSVSFGPGEPRYTTSVDLDIATSDHLLAVAAAYRDQVAQSTLEFGAAQQANQQAHAPAALATPRNEPPSLALPHPAQALVEP